MKYTRPLLIAIIAIIPLSIMFSITSNAGWVVISYSFYAIIGTLIGFGLAPLFLWVYKKIIGRNRLFAIEDTETTSEFHSTWKGFFPALMSTNFTLSLIFNPMIMNFPMFQNYYLQWDGIIFLFFNLGAILQIPSFALFSAAWIIVDSGLYTTDKYDHTDIEGVGRWFEAFLKGYAGISVILTLYQFTFDFLGEYGNQVHYSAVLFLFIMPILVTLWVLPAIILFEATHGSRQNFILNFSKRIGIKKEFESSVRVISQPLDEN